MCMATEYKCEECGENFGYRKTLGRHVREIHGLMYQDYLARHGKSERLRCGCGKEFENTRFPGGPRMFGRRQKYCSMECTQKSTNVRYYGLELKEYHEMLQKQDYQCAICRKHVDDERRLLAVDHEHVEGFSEMSPENRKKYVRGLLCILCNKHRMAEMNLQVAERIVEYLRKYSSRVKS